MKTAGKGDASLKLSRFVSATVRKEMAAAVPVSAQVNLGRQCLRLGPGFPLMLNGMFSCADLAGDLAEECCVDRAFVHELIIQESGLAVLVL